MCQTNASSSSNSTIYIVDGECVSIWCHIRYHGHWAPTIECKQDGIHVIPALNSITTQNDTVATIYNLKIQFGDMAKNRVLVSCKTYFDRNNFSKNNSASNVPEYEYTWNISFTADEKGENLFFYFKFGLI